MLYRKLEKAGWDLSILGFGCMRLPVLRGSGGDSIDPGQAIDEDLASRMVDYAVQQGVNYFDTAFPYHAGQSEPFLGRAVKAHRDKVKIATKSPVWMIQAASDFDRILDEQLRRLDMPFVDVYLLHGLGRATWAKSQALGALDFLERARKDGRVKYIGFSFHDDLKAFKEIIEGYDWTLCQIQYNYFDEHYQAGREGLDLAAARGVGVVVMEPLRGGKLTEKLPTDIVNLWDTASIRRTPAEWALRWVWNHPAVSVTLSGMTAMEHVVENIRIAEHGRPDSLTGDELRLIGEVADAYRRMLKIPCTGCAYCMPCPNGVNIPGNFSMYNDTFMFKDPERTVFVYNHFWQPEFRASNCQECGQCEDACPQHIPIMEELKKVHGRLGR